MANMEKCYYCDFDENGDATYKHEDVLCRKVGEIQDDSIILFASICESLEEKEAFFEIGVNGDYKSGIGDLIGVSTKIHYCPMCGRRLAEDWEKKK